MNLFLPALFCAAGACAQGTVVFDNNFAVTGVGVLLRARVYAPEPSDPYIEKHGNALEIGRAHV